MAFHIFTQHTPHTTPHPTITTTIKKLPTALLVEVGLFNLKSKTSAKATQSMEEVLEANINYSKKFSLNVTELDKSLPIKYWSPNMHQTPICARFVAASN